MRERHTPHIVHGLARNIVDQGTQDEELVTVVFLSHPSSGRVCQVRPDIEFKSKYIIRTICENWELLGKLPEDVLTSEDSGDTGKS